MDLFAYIFLLSQRLQYISDKVLEADDLTTKQFLMLAVTEKAFDHPPGLKEVAEALGTSHQNVKQMADQLKRKGFIEMTRDPADRRVTRLRTTQQNRLFWDSRAEKHIHDILNMFQSLTDQEISTMYETTTKLYHTLQPTNTQTPNT